MCRLTLVQYFNQLGVEFKRTTKKYESTMPLETWQLKVLIARGGKKRDLKFPYLTTFVNCGHYILLLPDLKI